MATVNYNTPGPITINETEGVLSNKTLPGNASLELRTSVISQPQIGALYREKVIILQQVDVGPPGPPGEQGPPGNPGIWVGSDPPPDPEAIPLWIKI